MPIYQFSVTELTEGDDGHLVGYGVDADIDGREVSIANFLISELQPDVHAKANAEKMASQYREHVEKAIADELKTSQSSPPRHWKVAWSRHQKT